MNRRDFLAALAGGVAAAAAPVPRRTDCAVFDPGMSYPFRLFDIWQRTTIQSRGRHILFSGCVSEDYSLFDVLVSFDPSVKLTTLTQFLGETTPEGTLHAAWLEASIEDRVVCQGPGFALISQVRAIPEPIAAPGTAAAILLKPWTKIKLEVTLENDLPEPLMIETVFSGMLGTPNASPTAEPDAPEAK